MHYHVGHNMPGYLPESDVACVETATAAWMIWNEDITHALDCIDDDGEFLDLDTARNTVTVADIELGGGAWFMVNGIAYWIERITEDRANCELADDDQ